MEAPATEVKKKSSPVIPWMRDPVDISISGSCPLSSLRLLNPRLETALDSMGITSLFPVQIAVWQETIGPGSYNRDLCINSPTGSGKTLAYALPIVQTLSSRTVKCLQALVVLPTRDLAVQVKEVFAALGSAVGLSVGLAVGQSSIADEISLLGSLYPTGNKSSLIGTPGILLQHSSLIEKPNMGTSICDEAEDFVREPKSSVDILVATPGRLMDHINNTDGFTLEHLCYLLCTSKLKPLYLLALLGTLQGEKSIVFTSSVESTHRLCTLLNFFGDLQIKIKEYSRLQREVQVLISSDAMTRGMDVEGVKNVINYDMPTYTKTYIHRAGQTARAGQIGCCFTLLHKDEVARFNKLLRKADYDSCPIFSVPSESVESFQSMYRTALERLKRVSNPKNLERAVLGASTQVLFAKRRKLPEEYDKKTRCTVEFAPVLYKITVTQA
ncbi:dead box ATP-dependent RNA helicase [Striga asiatica]|uniref:ATP-dependent RNA helicase n=1 Tax=Striga asiatica TaxID=4170 RepID=A0A5A7QY26_STRAF|nr:dead box ATP-dependent RNA helicase [Striga asiatica]